ncbi:MAG TPA: ABC transporter ATP-binding protein [Clostridiales bacterium]|nr:ABC transporter ATP-binding protein [Clostridiales bacterium]
MNAIEVKNLTKKYSGFTLDNISFSLPTGSIMGFVGENGAGKSTTIKLIMNAIPRDSGEIKVLGLDNQSPEFTSLKNDIGIVLDEAYFPEVITAANVNTIMKHTYSKWSESTYFNYIKKFDLPINKAFKDFSRGMKMKLAIAVALSHDPKLLILDEATSGLDPMVRDEILDIFNDFTRDEGHSVLLSSHIVSDLEKICDYITFIHRGKIMLCEEKDRLLEEYAIIKLPKSAFDEIPQEAVKGKKITNYGVEALILKSKISPSFEIQHTTLEDIVLFLAKGDGR